MSEKTGPVLHWAEEYGQSRELTSNEVVAWLRLSFTVFGAAFIVAVVAINYIRNWAGLALSWRSVVFDPLSLAALLASIAFLLNFIPFLVNSLRSERRAESYAPPQPEVPQLPSPWRPPLPAHHRGGTTMIDMNERPMLPDPRAARQITPPVVAEVLRASIEEYGGQWSRRKLMRLRVLGQKVSRGMYEELTSALHQCGLLQQTRQGGFELPHDVETFEDLADYLPSLPGLGGMGGKTGGLGTGGDSDRPTFPAGETLAEKRRKRWLECDCDVKSYLKGKQA
jgi:hypothetical protein